jgi:hypothetical protein
MKLLFLKSWPFLTIFLVVFLFFWKVFLLGQVPIPGDFIVGTYYPWLDYKWGYSVGVPVKNPVTSDVVSIIYPLRSYAMNLLREGHLPLWNPFMFNGSPLLADFQVGIFSPTMIFYLFLPNVWAWTVQVMLQPLMAAIFTYLLLRHFGLKKAESVFGGIFYAFASFNIIWMEWNANSLTAAFIPLLILLLDKFINSDGLYWGVMLSIGICLQVFSGYPQVVIFTMMALLVLVLFRLRKITKVKFIFMSLFILAGFLLSSIVTIPGSELILNSQRKYETLAHDLIYFPWQNLITFLAPDYFGNPATGNYFGAGNYAINSGYSGIVVLGLALIGIFQYWKKKEVKYFVCLTILALLLALPTPLAKLLFNSPIPGISASSNTRILVLANLSLSTLAAYGVSGLFKKERIVNFKVVFVPLIILLGILLWTFLVGVNREISLRNLVLPIGFTLLMTFLVILREKYYKKRSLNFLLVIAVCTIAVIELFRYGWKYTPFSSSNLVFPETPILTFLKNDKNLFRISPGNVIPMNMWVPYNLESVSGYDAVYPIWWARLFGVITSNDSKNFSFSYYAPFDKYGSPWFDLLNNKYLLVFDPITASGGSSDKILFNQIDNNIKFEKVFQDKSVAIFKNKNVLPRALFVSDWEIESDVESLSTLIDPNFPFREKIIIDKGTDLKKSKDVKSEVSYDLYLPERSIMTVSTNKEGFLFVSDSWYPGWRATVDNVDTPIYRADYAFRAVPVLKGVHKVEFIYDPGSLKIGKLLSLTTLVFLIGVIIFEKHFYEKRK